MQNWVDLECLSINQVLEKLKKKDLVENEIRGFEDQSSRKVYSITKKGKKVF